MVKNTDWARELSAGLLPRLCSINERRVAVELLAAHFTAVEAQGAERGAKELADRGGCEAAWGKANAMTEAIASLADHRQTEDHSVSRHKWGECVSISGFDTATGNDQSERACLLCGLVKITVHPPHGFPWREWRARGQEQVKIDATPPCVKGK